MAGAEEAGYAYGTAPLEQEHGGPRPYACSRLRCRCGAWWSATYVNGLPMLPWVHLSRAGYRDFAPSWEDHGESSKAKD